MRRAVRDYKYEVNEGRMTEECNQYLQQLQKDWERHRVKMGVEQMRKEVSISAAALKILNRVCSIFQIGEREREREESSASPSLHDVSINSEQDASTSSLEIFAAQRSIDALFDRTQEKLRWEPAKAPDPLGELLDSRHMLPLLLPSDPRMLGVLPTKPASFDDEKRTSVRLSVDSSSRSTSRASFGNRGAMGWRYNRHLRDIGLTTLQWVDGSGAAARWTRPELEPVDPEDDDEKPPPPYSPDELGEDGDELKIDTAVHLTMLTRAPSGRSRGRASVVGGTPIEREPSMSSMIS